MVTMPPPRIHHGKWQRLTSRCLWTCLFPLHFHVFYYWLRQCTTSWNFPSSGISSYVSSLEPLRCVIGNCTHCISTCKPHFDSNAFKWMTYFLGCQHTTMSIVWEASVLYLNETTTHLAFNCKQHSYPIVVLDTLGIPQQVSREALTTIIDEVKSLCQSKHMPLHHIFSYFRCWYFLGGCGLIVGSLNFVVLQVLPQV